MAWKDNPDGTIDPDGTPFDEPADSYERRYNQFLQEEGRAPDRHEMDVSEGWPLTSRAAEPKPRSAEEARRILDAFHSPHFQDQALTAGNTHEELDKISKDALTWAAYHRAPVTAGERNLAKRLGVEVDSCPDVQDDRIRHHSRLGV